MQNEACKTMQTIVDSLSGHLHYVIGITGRAGSGKTTFANLLAKHFDEHLRKIEPRRETVSHYTVVLPMAFPLKDIAYKMGWNGNKDAKGRRLLQLLGTECGRECIDEDTWVNKWLLDINSLPKSLRIVIADDLRFDNEAKTVVKFGTKHLLFEMTCRGYDLGAASNHASEKGISDLITHRHINNSVPLEALDDYARQVVEELNYGK